MMAIIARTQITPITMPAMAPTEIPVRVWDERLEVGIVADGEDGPMVGEEGECVVVWTVFDPVVMVAPLGGRAIEPMVTRFS